MAIDKEMISQIKHNVNIVDVIGEVVHLSRAGRHYLGLCPFHKEKHPLLMSLKIDSSFTALAAVSREMFLSLLRNIVRFLFRKCSDCG